MQLKSCLSLALIAIWQLAVLGWIIERSGLEDDGV
jgi:hypothetical protein